MTETPSRRPQPPQAIAQDADHAHLGGVRQAKRYRYYVCAVIFLCYLLVFFHRLCPAVIALDIQTTFGLSDTVLGLLASAYFYPYALLQMPTGILADSWGSRKTVASSFVLAGVGALLTGLAPSLGWAVLGRVLVGAGVATVFVCNFKLLSQWFCIPRFVIMGSLFMAVGGVGALSAGVPLAWLSSLMGWRATMVVVAGFTLLMAVVAYLVVRDEPRQMGWPAINQQPGQGSRPARSPRPAELWAGVREVVGARRFWPPSFWAFCATGLAFAVSGLWGGPYLMEVYGLSKAAAGGVLSTFALALVAGTPVLGALANRLGRKPVLTGGSWLTTAVFLVLFLFPGGLPLWLLYVLFFAMCLGSAATGPILAAVSKELFRLEIAGTSVGLVNIFPFLGAALLQVAMGYIVSHYKASSGGDVVLAYKMMFLFAVLVAAASFVFARLLTETKPRGLP
ncbi:MAG: MFS transporter [Thermodesulfobacteriota bacterium]